MGKYAERNIALAAASGELVHYFRLLYFYSDLFEPRYEAVGMLDLRCRHSAISTSHSTRM